MKRYTSELYMQYFLFVFAGPLKTVPLPLTALELSYLENTYVGFRNQRSFTDSLSNAFEPHNKFNRLFDGPVPYPVLWTGSSLMYFSTIKHDPLCEDEIIELGRYIAELYAKRKDNNAKRHNHMPMLIKFYASVLYGHTDLMLNILDEAAENPESYMKRLEHLINKMIEDSWVSRHYTYLDEPRSLEPEEMLLIWPLNINARRYHILQNCVVLGYDPTWETSCFHIALAKKSIDRLHGTEFLLLQKTGVPLGS